MEQSGLSGVQAQKNPLERALGLIVCFMAWGDRSRPAKG